ncbi:MAG TPA: DUF6036 family nucleotidyltransferase [Candidatus Angelobacter sp.]|jgi:hypothetical protein|nr:DUF6036 family nucleotidyltransferase [Candidatus Angelobacter sp.]
MSPDAAKSLPPRWLAFLREVDKQLNAPVELHCLGGFVLAAVYGLPRPTADVDYIAAIPSDTLPDLERIAGRGSALAEKQGLYFQYVTVADVPEGYAERLTELLPCQLFQLRLLALDVHDLVLAKLVRNSPVDIEDAKFLANTGELDKKVLQQRYEKELRPNLSNETRHDLTLELWLEACFHAKPQGSKKHQKRPEAGKKF